MKICILSSSPIGFSWFFILFYTYRCRMDGKPTRGNLGLSKSAAARPNNRKICSFWAAGRCNRNPCRFMHGEPLRENSYHHLTHQSQYQPTKTPKSTIGERGCLSTDHPHSKLEALVCHYWLEDKCVRGDRCPFPHTSFQGDDFTLLAKLKGHKKVRVLIFFFFFWVCVCVWLFSNVVLYSQCSIYMPCDGLLRQLN